MQKFMVNVIMYVHCHACIWSSRYVHDQFCHVRYVCTWFCRSCTYMYMNVQKTYLNMNTYLGTLLLLRTALLQVKHKMWHLLTPPWHQWRSTNTTGTFMCPLRNLQIYKEENCLHLKSRNTAKLRGNLTFSAKLNFANYGEYIVIPCLLTELTEWKIVGIPHIRNSVNILTLASGPCVTCFST